MLSALGTAVFAAASARRPVEIAAMVAMWLAVALTFGPDRLPDIMLAGLAAAVGAAIYLVAGSWAAVLSAAVGGGVAGVWTLLLQVQGLPAPAAIAVVGILVVFTAWFARSRAVFAPEAIRDEALLTIVLLGAAVAVLPSVTDGWQSARALNADPGGAVAPGIPIWTASLVLMSFVFGGSCAVWSRR
jgi:hypothetical protein